MRTALLLAFCTLLCGAACAAGSDHGKSATGPAAAGTVLDRATQQSLTPDQVLKQLEEGNRRFVEGRLTPRDYRAQVGGTAEGQFPKATPGSAQNRDRAGHPVRSQTGTSLP